MIQDCHLAKGLLCDTTAIDIELAELQNEIEVVTELSRKAIFENARTAVNQAEWNEKNNNYLERHKKATERMDELDAAKRERIGKGKIIDGFIRDIKNCPLAISEFDEKLWLATIDHVSVCHNSNMAFMFKNGTEITV